MTGNASQAANTRHVHEENGMRGKDGTASCAPNAHASAAAVKKKAMMYWARRKPKPPIVLKMESSST